MCEAAEARGSTASLSRAVAAEDVAEALRDNDAEFRSAEVGYTTCVPSRDEDETLLVDYVQGCTGLGGGDGELQLDALMKDEVVGPYLRSMRSWSRDGYAFSQRVHIMVVRKPAG